MYIGAEYESRFLLKRTAENLESTINELGQWLLLNGYTYVGEFSEKDYYFLSNCPKKTMKYAVNAKTLKGRIIYKEEIGVFENIVVNLEISETTKSNELVNVLKRFPYIKTMEFDFNNIGKLFQTRRKYVQLGVNDFERINCSVDVVKYLDSYYIFVEFETSVSSPKVIDHLRRISMYFEGSLGFETYIIGKRGMVLFEADK